VACGTAFGTDFGLAPAKAAAVTGTALLGLCVVASGLRGHLARLARLRRGVRTNAKILLGLAQVRPPSPRSADTTYPASDSYRRGPAEMFWLSFSIR
jgi:hypothetical protein